MAAAHTRTGAARGVVPGAVRRAGRWAVNLLMLLVVVGGAAWLAPAALGYSRYVITGGSMTGTYDKGSVVFEKPVPVGDLQVGDVITYMPPPDAGVPHLVTHRILRMQPADGGGVLFTTQGDNNPDPDPWHFKLLDSSQPVVQAGVPTLGWVFIALAHREVRMGVIGLPAAVVALMALAELAGAVRERRRGVLVPELAPSVPSQRSPAPEPDVVTV